MLKGLALLALIASSALANHAHWSRAARASPEQLVQFVVAVKQQNVDALEKALLQVSDPDSPAYGKHLSGEAVHDLLAPSRKSLKAVYRWFGKHGVSRKNIRSSPNGDFLVADLPIQTVEKLTGASYFKYKHQRRQSTVHRAAYRVGLPEEIRDHVDFFSPNFNFPAESGLRILVEDTAALTVTPDFIRTLYYIDAQHKIGQAKNNIQATAQFLGQYYSPSDLQSFTKTYNSGSPFNLSSIEVFGPNVVSNPGVEASLDIEYLTAIGNNIPTQFYSTAGEQPGSPENEPFLEWLYVLGNTTDSNLPLVMSVSYGDNEDTVEFDYATRVNVEFQKAGLRGMSILFASGDGGVSGGQAQSCTKFVPTFPAASPWVTAVGGTTGSPETSASFSTGGFSNYWSRPQYQDSFVATYLAKPGIPSESLFNISGAAFPDVSAQSSGFAVVDSGRVTSVGGTSAAAPTFAGVVSLLNDARLLAGKSPLGFLNPFLYKNPGILNDITTGSNPGCGTNGFPATVGWDAVTGLGTPNFPKLLAAVLALS